MPWDNALSVGNSAPKTQSPCLIFLAPEVNLQFFVAIDRRHLSPLPAGTLSTKKQAPLCYETLIRSSPPDTTPTPGQGIHVASPFQNPRHAPWQQRTSFQTGCSPYSLANRPLPAHVAHQSVKPCATPERSLEAWATERQRSP